MNSHLKIALFFALLLFPVLLGSITARVAFSRAERVEFCGSCHTMQPWIDDVTGSESESLAGAHFANRWIQHDQCYTCHSNYSFMGPLKAKIRGVEHVIAFYGGYTGPIHLREDFPNINCLQCHEHSKGFREESAHDPIDDLLAGKDRCVECHDQLHDVETGESADDAADEAAPGGEDEGDEHEDDGGGE